MVRIRWQSPAYPGAVPELAVDIETIGLVVVDLQISCSDPDTGYHKPLEARMPERYAAWADRIRAQVVPNVRHLLNWFHAAGRPVIYTRVGSLLPDAADQHAKRREAWGRTGVSSPPRRSYPGAPDFEILPALAPRPVDLVVDKNTSSAFIGSPLAFHVAQLGLHTLVVAGVSTFACVDGTVRDAADLGLNVIVVEDACAAAPGREEAHRATVCTLGRLFCAVKNTREVLDDLETLAAPASVGRRFPGT